MRRNIIDTLIPPSVGRKVWFQPGPDESVLQKRGEQPMDATVLFVEDDNRVSLLVVDHNGATQVRHNIAILAPEELASEERIQDETNGRGEFAYWMGFQRKQALQASLAQNYAYSNVPTTGYVGRTQDVGMVGGAGSLASAGTQAPEGSQQRGDDTLTGANGGDTSTGSTGNNDTAPAADGGTSPSGGTGEQPQPGSRG